MDMKNSRYEKEKIIFFDGICQLCNNFVDFLIARDKLRNFYYASLQGETSSSLLDPVDRQELGSVVYLENGQIFYKSKAVLKIFRRLSFPWNFIGLIGIFIPIAAADKIYDFIAKNRYRWFGKKETCRLPTAEEKAYFLP